MIEIVECINSEDYKNGYSLLELYLDTYKSTSEFDFLFECVPQKAYTFILYCLEHRRDNILRLMLCHLLTYGEMYVKDYHSIIYEQITSIMRSDPCFEPALEFAIYNYFEHPESPFSNAELLEYSRTLLRTHDDRIALKIIKKAGDVSLSGDKGTVLLSPSEKTEDSASL